MYGRGRGSYLGLLLESQTGKNAGVASTAAVQKTSNNSEVGKVSEDSSSPSNQTSSSQDNEGRSPQPTWTSLDLLGNRGKRSRHGSDSTPKPAQEISQVSEDDQKRDLKDDLATLQSTSIGSEILPDQKPKLSSDPVKKIHLIPPKEFLLSPQANSSMINEVPQTEFSEIESSSDANESNTSSSPRYIPPHRRKGFTGKPDIYPDTAVTKYKKLDLSRFTSTGETTETTDPRTLVESELSWQKWKLQRTFKKLLNSLSSENVVGFNAHIRKACEASQLSAKFPGTSELNVLVDLLLSRVIEQKESFEVAVHICRLLNVMYQNEFPANLKDVLRQYRQEIFSGVANKNTSCENFCIFIGKLCEVAKDESKSFQDCLRQSVIGCLHDWISPFQNADECSQEAEVKISYLCHLLEVTKTVLTTEKKSWIKSCFGKIKNCILSDKVARSLKENLVDHVIKCSLSSPTAKESDRLKVNTESLSSSKAAESVPNSTDNSDAYKNVKKMLSDLELNHLLEKFQENLIRDTLLCANRNELKNTLQEAGFAPGAVLEIQLYLEKSVENFTDNVPEKSLETKPPGRDIDPRSQVKDIAHSLKQVLVKLESEKQKRAENENEDENQIESSTDVETVETLDVKELQNQLANIQNGSDLAPISSSTSSCRPPPGFSYPGNENRRTPIPEPVEDIQVNCNELSSSNDIPESVTQREVTIGEKKSNIMEFKDENTQAGNPVVNWIQNDGTFKRNSNERTLPLKYKGRGRGRRDITGMLEDTKRDYNGSQGFSWDTRGSRWNSRDVKGYQYESGRDKNGYAEFSHWNKSDSPEMSRRGNSGPQSSWRGGMRGFSWKDDRPFGNAEENDGNTKMSTKDTLDTDTTEGQKSRVEFGLYSSADASLGISRVPFGSSVPSGCFICGSKEHRSAYCKNNSAMFD